MKKTKKNKTKESEQDRRRRLLTVKLLEEAGNPDEYFYHSFADDSGFLGGVMVAASGHATSLRRAHKMGINPGGEVLTQTISAEVWKRIPDEFKWRLLTKEDVERFDSVMEAADAADGAENGKEKTVTA